MVGTISLENLIWEEGKVVSGELGYWLSPEFQGQGLMTEAGAAVVDFAFHTLKIQRLSVGCFAANQASKQLIKKLQFQLVEKKELANPNSQGALEPYEIYLLESGGRG